MIEALRQMPPEFWLLCIAAISWTLAALMMGDKKGSDG
jgi:hypothetical protein